MFFSLIGCLIRDFAEIVPLVTTIIFLGSPILYPASKLDNLAWIANINIPYFLFGAVRTPSAELVWSLAGTGARLQRQRLGSAKCRERELLLGALKGLLGGC